jgi:signal transduction histidine kinase
MKTESYFGVHCRFSAGSNVIINDNQTATHLFYIAQEAVNNAIRHGKARNIVIQLLEINGRILLSVDDDGCGMEEDHKSDGMGLRIMGFRAKMINATLDVRSGRGEGTLAQVVLDPMVAKG